MNPSLLAKAILSIYHKLLAIYFNHLLIPSYFTINLFLLAISNMYPLL